MQKLIPARWPSFCAETGKRIPKGEIMLYDYAAKKCYKGSVNPATGEPFSKKYAEAAAKAEQGIEAESLRAYVQAQEDAFCDNRYRP